MSEKSVLVVVAHPDDESVWCAGYLAQHPGTDVFCASTPNKDPERADHFLDACQVLKANGAICSIKSKAMNVRPAQKAAEHYQTIITHNHLGEYGHPFHVKLHHAIMELGKQTWCFNYGILEGEPINADIKRQALACYTTRPNVWRNQSKHFDLSKECLIRYS